MIYKPVAHIIEDIVSAMRDEYSVEQIVPYYEYGVTNEVVNRLSIKGSNANLKNSRYPLLWYLIDGSVKEGVSFSGANRRVVDNVTIIICNKTDSKYSAKERYEKNFIPILRPLYEAFMYQLRRSTAVRSINNYQHSYYENLFWGRDGLYGHVGNIFNDMLDAIIIEDLSLSIIEKCD